MAIVLETANRAGRTLWCGPTDADRFIFSLTCPNQSAGCVIMYTLYGGSLAVATLDIVHEECSKELAACIPSRETIIDRERLIRCLNICHSCYCWLCPCNVAAGYSRKYYGCCVECRGKHVQETSALIARIFLVGHMGLIEDITRVIMQALVGVL
jgi:hypothetical protein